MQKQFNTWFGVALVMFLWVGTMGESLARQSRTLCGVDVSYQYRCWKELRRLVTACKKTPVICGRSYKSGEIPKSKVAQGHCKHMYRVKRRQWREGLCGVRLFSRPNTYCGVRGVQVAIACIRERNKGMKPPVKTASAESKVAPRIAPVIRSVKHSPVKKRTTKKVATRKAEKKPVVGLVKAVANQGSRPGAGPSGTSGSSFWLYALQFLTLGLVLLLLLRRSDRSSGRTWEQRTQRWEQIDSQWDLALEKDSDMDLSRVENSLEQIELRLQVWEEQWRESLSSNDPIGSLQQWSNAVHSYYCRIASVLSDGRPQPSLSAVQTRLLEARDKFRWMFQAHREPLAQASAIERLQEELLERTQSLLEQTGYTEDHLQFSKILSQGQFSVDDFLARKAEDQAQRFLQDEPLQNFSTIRNEFLQRLEQLYRSNLSTLLQGESSEGTVEISEQSQIYKNEFILAFLLEELPKKLEDYSHQSNRERSGALSDMMLNFIEEELQGASMELFPAMEESDFMSTHARFMYLSRAGVRMIEKPDVILREAHATLLEVYGQTESTEHELSNSDIVPTLAKYSSDADSAEQRVGVTLEQPDTSPARSHRSRARVGGHDLPRETAAYSQDLLGDIDEITTSHGDSEETIQSIGTPDSDPPTAEATTDLQGHVNPEDLPAGPLPTIDPAQNFASKGQRNTKNTREYGSISNFPSHDSELPYSLHPSKES